MWTDVRLRLIGWSGHGSAYLAILWFVFIALTAGPFFSLQASAADENGRQHITVGSELDYPPFALVTGGQADGFSVDLMKAVCAAMDIDVTFRVGPWAEVRTALEKGGIDALPLVSYSKERDQVFDFTVPHTVANGVVFKRKDSPPSGRPASCATRPSSRCGPTPPTTG